ncbi:MAG: FAD-binding protein [Pseudomonadota bacterium]|nr:FAD-binding protein [Pseudomonadota bacterium]
MKCLVIHCHPQSLSALNATIDAASRISDEIDLVLVGDMSPDVLKTLGVSNIFHYSSYQYPCAKVIAYLISQHYQDYSHILCHSDTTGKDYLPYFCGQKQIPLITEVRAIQSPTTFERAIYAGSAIETIETEQAQVLLTIRGIYFLEQKNASPTIHPLTPNIPPEIADSFPKLIQEPTQDGNNVDLSTAEVVVSGGRGFGSEDSFKQLEALAQHFHAGLGASRAAVDAGYIGNEHQVGQTGKQIAPRLYFAFGISGAVQHLSGMKDSQTIIAVDKDPDAPIFKVAQYGFAGNLFDVIPELMKKNIK